MTVLSNGLDLSTIPRADFREYLAALAASGTKEPSARKKKERAACIISPHTGQCTRCGSPTPLGECDPQAGYAMVPSAMFREWYADPSAYAPHIPTCERTDVPVSECECA